MEAKIKMKQIDAALLQKMLIGGAKRLEANKEYINELNVFPVPDVDVICIGTIYLLFFENYIAVEAGERNTVSDYLEEVVLENEIKGQEDVRKKEKREITFHRAPRVMEESFRTLFG